MAHLSPGNSLSLYHSGWIKRKNWKYVPTSSKPWPVSLRHYFCSHSVNKKLPHGHIKGEGAGTVAGETQYFACQVTISARVFLLLWLPEVDLYPSFYIWKEQFISYSRGLAKFPILFLYSFQNPMSLDNANLFYQTQMWLLKIWQLETKGQITLFPDIPPCITYSMLQWRSRETDELVKHKNYWSVLKTESW